MRSTRALCTLVAGGVAMLLAACSMGTHGSQAGLDAGALRITTTPATSFVDKVTWNVFEGEPQTVDPYHSADYTPNMINSNMCENLLAQTPDFGIKPNLATAYHNPDPLHWVYDLRDDVTFWDGSPMTAEDVAFSLRENLTDKTSFYNYLYLNVKSVDVTGPHQVTVTLRSPDYLFNSELADYAGVVVEKKFFLEHAKSFGSPSTGVMCTGPFEFEKWAQGQSITLVRNPHYWNASLRPKVGTLVFTFLTDNSAITAGLLSGEIDGTYGVPTSGYTQLRNSPVGTLTVGPAPLNITIVYANPKGPMSNLQLRRALQLAIDWKGVGNRIYAGLASPLTMQTPPAAYGFAAKQLDALAASLPAPRSADYAAARKIVQSVPADVRSRPITMVVPDTSDTQQLGLAVKDAAGRIGLDFRLKVVPTTGYSNYLYDPQTRAGVDILYTQFWPNVADPMDWLGITAVTGGTFNQYGYDGIDAVYAKAVGTKDPAVRARLVAQMERTLHEQLLPMVPGVGLVNTVWMNKRITGAPASFDYVYYPWAAHLGGAK
ncbi:putative Peptide/opine/nickel uptake ABC transporter periplasmic substrate-binding protein [Nostocoides japonicum T1-X7]|uniref:Putative Peptide/opine/nickel uptake ABC transporter periplasmic substrate-binding protein n=1 Tax=Nostocoides japonicum T1-X7 TaxID=1194083 RepID=A0A077M2V9_9MICO|nr:ABC transporter substrate-binding protein [Tetrasphaera japonica]CCH79432.1 putative Peptide/opine/nickel uptake ABC transporter periplasmic substrate-binding protein [Tetrasphaera japonica T1-X7]